MNRLYFINDWYARLAWYYKGIFIIAAIGIYSLIVFINNALDHIVYDVIGVALIGAVYGWLIFRNNCKNAFIYESREQFGIRIDGERVDMEARHVSEVSLDKNHELQIRRINRVDKFDLSNIRNGDREKLLKYLKEFTGDRVEIQSAPILG